MSGFKTSGFKTSETSGLQNVSFTKYQVYKMSGLRNVMSSKRAVAKIIHLDSVLLYKGGGEGSLLHVPWVDRNLVVPL